MVKPRYDSIASAARLLSRPTSTGPVHLDRTSRACGEGRLDLRCPIGCDEAGFRVCLPLDVFQRDYGAGESSTDGNSRSGRTPAWSTGSTNETFTPDCGRRRYAT